MSPKDFASFIVIAFGTAALLQGCGGSGGDDKPDADKLIPAIAGKNSNLSTLVSALTAAGLVDTLKGEGPFTVFAPNNHAFEGLRFKGAELTYLLNNVDKLSKVLQGHVVKGKVMSTDLKNNENITTLNGELTVTIADGKVSLSTLGGATTDAQVVKADVEASNGVIHVIDKVLMERSWYDSFPKIPTLLPTVGNFTVLANLLSKAALIEALKANDTAYTVFAPTDEAFGKLPAGTLEKLEADIPALTNLLLLHVVKEERPAKSLSNGDQLASMAKNATTQEPENLVITITGKDADKVVQVNNAKVTKADQFAVNGVIHVIDAVLSPKKAANTAKLASVVV
jgi:uncharacterized surface protein with fasciclin (FAS1) repeats